ncbi:hydroxymyristoyl-ACP dehydratase [Clostridium fermenticellae]|uniref:Hydroxymyristoyl-ACP dehydratase n=1 Tax=Clostridium fermenticellae TaxID=2068654 RepID=A0A386H1L8_9CLOT|nr:hydroxymyristoyl-ACP dehydratase [Clostridium fermenticellae]AYD39589.1 hydroxymyristoyl-ACP dehydratase [Clostridium fermenticellae]
MMNINCSEKCIHEKNGKCTLDHVMQLSNAFNSESKCAYFTAKPSNQTGFPKK